jgi:hypothetical protein
LLSARHFVISGTSWSMMRRKLGTAYAFRKSGSMSLTGRPR